MTKVFKTPEDYDETVEIVGAGVAGPNGKGGIPVDRASATMVELQTAGGVPLTGKDLDTAASDYAEGHGLEVVNVAEKQVASLAQEWGVPPDPIPCGEAAEAEYVRVYGSGDSDEAEPATAEASASTESSSKTKED